MLGPVLSLYDPASPPAFGGRKGALWPAQEDPCNLGRQIQGWFLEPRSLMGFGWLLPRAPLLVAPLLSFSFVHVVRVHGVCQLQSGSAGARGGSCPHKHCAWSTNDHHLWHRASSAPSSLCRAGCLWHGRPSSPRWWYISLPLISLHRGMQVALLLLPACLMET